MTATGATAPTSTELAGERTRLAHERTLMAWTRTATSLISFGFTIYKFLEYVHKDKPPGGDEIGRRWFPMLMIVIGLVALVLATVEHRRSMRQLRAVYGRRAVPVSLSAVVAALVAALGILGLLAVLFHL